MTTFTCEACSITLPVKTSMESTVDYHQRHNCAAKSYQLKLKQGLSVIIKMHTEDMLFHCLCNQGQCQKTYNIFRSLQEHIKKGANPTLWGHTVSVIFYTE